MKSPAFLLAAAAGALAFGAPAVGQVTQTEEVKVNQLIVYGTDPCPASTEAEITVCARRPEGDRFRIPGPLRGLTQPQSESWTNRALELQYVGRTGTESCSPVGPGGATGCLQRIINAARAERQGSDAVDWNALIEDARQQRLGRIDADSEEIERDEIARERAEPR